jgi:NTE family protein
MGTELHEPVEPIAPTATDPGSPEKGIAICLSGGGYRAMLFHVGALWRLQEFGYLNITVDAPHAQRLGSLARISSVSGGSISSAQVALRWPRLATDNNSVATRRAAFIAEIVQPIRKFSTVNIAGLNLIAILKMIGAIVLPGSVNAYVGRMYQRHLYGRATLQELPDVPRFVINASNLQSGALWRFSKPYIRDWRVGEIKNPDISIARAVAASSAFPPPLSPARFAFKDSDYAPRTGGTGPNDLQHPPYTTRVRLSDGGVYDNLGLETAWKRYQTILVSDAGKPFQFEQKPGTNWLSIALRVIGCMDNQVRALRIRQLIAAFSPHATGPTARSGCYRGIGTDIASYSCPNALPCPVDKTRLLAAIPTDLAAKSPDMQEKLINWGYAVCDAAMRTYVDPGLPRPDSFPYGIGVG